MENRLLDFEIDKLTRSIENAVTGDSFLIEISLLSKKDLALITKKNNWLFNWREEFNDLKKEVYKLTIAHNSQVIQGLISLTIEDDHVLCISLKAHLSTEANIKCTSVYPVI